MRDWLRTRLGGSRDGVHLHVDGPNVLREEFDVDLAALREQAESLDRLAVCRLYLDEHASPGLVRAAEANGYAVVVTSGDVDVRLAVDATAGIFEQRPEWLAIASRDADFAPVFERAARAGVRTAVFTPGDHGRSAALRAAADVEYRIEGRSVEAADSDPATDSGG